jgi:hypothetical protein
MNARAPKTGDDARNGYRQRAARLNKHALFAPGLSNAFEMQ